MKCICCDGDGRRYDRKDRDVIEGYKLASKTLVCFFCEGTGIISDDDARSIGCEAYNKAMAKHNSKIQRQNAARDAKRLTLQRSGLRKLTPQEKEALGIKVRVEDDGDEV